MKIKWLSMAVLAASMLLSEAVLSSATRSAELKQNRLPRPPIRIERRAPELPPHQDDQPRFPSREQSLPVRAVGLGQPTVNRSDIDAVIQAVRESVGVDGNVNLSYDNGPQSLSAQEYVSKVVGEMGVNVAITTRSDRINAATDQRYGLDPVGNSNNNYLESRRNRYINLPTTELIQSSVQLDPTQQQNRLAVLLYAQKHFPIENNADNVRLHQASGLSIFQTVYGGATEDFNNGPGERLAYGAYETSLIPDADGDGDLEGVTELGQEVLEALIANHILIDLSHASDESIMDTVAQVGGRVPVMANHTVAQDIPNHQGDAPDRGVNDEAIRAIASTKGVIGLTTLKYFLIGDDANCTDDALTREFVRHINYVVDVIEADSNLIGSEYVGFGSDSYIDGWESSGRWTSCELNAPNRWEQVLRVLATERAANGDYRYSITDLKNIAGLNFLRVLKATLPGYSQPQPPSAVARLHTDLQLPRYRFDWQDVSVRSSDVFPALQFEAEDVRYKLFLSGGSASRYGMQYKFVYSGDAVRSTITVPHFSMEGDSYNHYRGVIRAYDVNKPSRYIDSVPFFFDLNR